MVLGFAYIMEKTPAYKELSLQQLRSFSESARQQSLKRAAAALGLSHPTVWEQVHALERHLGTTLLEMHRRGCRLTADGACLLQLIEPLVTGADSLKQRFLEARALVPIQLTIATTPRTLVEDLPAVLRRFSQLRPDVKVVLREVDTVDVVSVVEAKQAELGISIDRRTDDRSARLEFEPCYFLEPILLMRHDHPLARRRAVRLHDLERYPVVNRLELLPDPAIRTAMSKLTFSEDHRHQVFARTQQVIQHYVRLNYGLGLTIGRMGLPANRDLHERSLSRLVGRIQVYAVRDKSNRSQALRAFVDLLQKTLRTRSTG